MKAWKLLLLLVFGILVSQTVFMHSEAVEDHATAETIEGIVLLLHIVTAVFMAWSLYALITLNESFFLQPKIDSLFQQLKKEETKENAGFVFLSRLQGKHFLRLDIRNSWAGVKKNNQLLTGGNKNENGRVCIRC
jgi:hypothetical protein